MSATTRLRVGQSGNKAVCFRLTPKAERTLTNVKSLYANLLDRSVTNALVFDRALASLEADLEQRQIKFTKEEMAVMERALLNT